MGKKYKKIITGVFVIAFAFIIKIPNINAACSVSVSAPGSVTVGSNFKVTSSVSSDVLTWTFVLGYDPSKVQLVSSSSQFGAKNVGAGDESKYTTYTFKALKSGSTSFNVTNVSLGVAAGENSYVECSARAGSATVSMKTLAEIEASYSRNNNLSSISIEGAELSPAFNSDTTEYTANLPIDTEIAKITATPEESHATITGAGDVAVKDGINKIEITVTSQHGEVKKYTINITVLEKDPIKVKVNGDTYSIVRKKGQVEKIPASFEETTVKIKDQEVAAYTSSLLKLTLVALKDSDGNIGLFIYDKSNNSFKAINEVTSNTSNIMILNDINTEVPKGFVKETIKIDKKKVTAFSYSKKRNSNYYLVYGIDLTTGNKSFYLYDKENGTYQTYYNDLTEFKDYQIDIRNYIIIGFLSLTALVILIKLLKLFSSKEKKISKLQKKIDKLNGKLTYTGEDEDIDVMDKLKSKSVDVKKIPDEEFVIPKKSKKEKYRELEEARRKLDSRRSNVKRVTLEDLEDDDF